MDRIQALDTEKVTGRYEGEEPHFVPATSPGMRLIEEMVGNIAATDFPVLIMGESGSGKEAVALRLHRRSLRHDQPFIKVVCGALSPEFFASLQHDTERGNGHNGATNIGTLFLDEIVELAATSQASLLQAFPDGEVASQGHSLSARIISATSRTVEELEQSLERGGLRKDLFYRLNGVCLRLPPLRERKEDIPALVEFFLKKNSQALSRPQPLLGVQALEIMQQYPWPGNIRELENFVRRIVALGSDSVVSDLGSPASAMRYSHESAENLSLKQTSREASRQAEKELILKVLARTHWNRKRAAQQLQISYKALLYKLRQMELDGTETL
jgi:two-component system, NtrC family, response regulator AtoC